MVSEQQLRQPVSAAIQMVKQREVVGSARGPGFWHSKSSSLHSFWRYRASNTGIPCLPLGRRMVISALWKTVSPRNPSIPRQRGRVAILAIIATRSTPDASFGPECRDFLWAGIISLKVCPPWPCFWGRMLVSHSLESAEFTILYPKDSVLLARVLN